ncbi:SRPBCC domain-containing protein [uncultured Tateyamaria sp.]|uniref:SRPBCC domain-containing protein n=1 Tax=Tateyamaria sp. 1078 TaxID=3417464 RepID=UPI0026238C2A|nr:SRPBCC domain-containing protein [uncultured Tateyamaria sp.]
MSTQFGQLHFDRQMNAAPARVFEALISPEERMAWGPPDTGFVVLIDAPVTPVPGAREMARVGPRDNPYVDVATDWVVIEAPTRLIYAETLSADGEVLATGFATFELTEEGAGTQLRATVHIANFAGEEMMEEVEGGWTHAVDALAAHVSAR